MSEETAPIKSEENARSLPSTEEQPVKNTATQKGKGPRKRTKTGCLTCRKRRIKCGEEKPRCNNCIKSKRECEGYGQRVVFRPPVGAIRFGTALPVQGPDGSGNVSTLSSAYVGSVHHSARPLGVSMGRPALLPIAPRPRQIDQDSDPLKQHMFSMGQAQDPPPTQSDHRGIYTGPQQIQPDTMERDSAFQAPGSAAQSLNPQFTTLQSNYASVDHALAGNNTWQQTNHYIPDMSTANYSSQAPLEQSDFNPPSSIGTIPSEYTNLGGATGSSHLAVGPHMFLAPEESQATTNYQSEFDDLYDVNTDEEMDGTSHTVQYKTNKKDLAAAPYQGNPLGPPLFAGTTNQSDFITLYRPSPLASPLMDPEVAYLLSHFMKNVGPTISIFEQRSIRPRAVFPGLPVANDQQSLWTSTFPMMALENQGLLQAILAFSSNNIARLNNQSTTAAFRHYHYALRRVGKSVALPHRRKDIGTLAATLLLALFEVMGADHTKWNSHVAGAAYLIRELDFANTVRDVRFMRESARIRQELLVSEGMWTGAAGQPIGGTFFENDVYCQVESEIDMDFISILMGQTVNYDDPQPGNDGSKPQPRQNLSAKDIEDYRIRSDLYWWYRKQDILQAMISGNPLLTPFHEWDRCPPRARIGRLDAVYGTVDHLLLLLARTIAFNTKDRKRKLKVMEQNGGEWRPPPGLFSPEKEGGGPGGPPPASTKPENPDKARNPSPPMFGMIPAPSRVRLPSGFQNVYPSAPSPSDSDTSGSADLEARTAEAEAEWGDIEAAFHLFERSLGPGLAPLPPDMAPETPTPFGPALHYRTLVIGCLWALYYTGLIILHRNHPSMPPAAMMAASVAAGKTAQYSQLISRIVAGVPYPQQHHGAPNPYVAGTLVEHISNLFFAAVQYDDPMHRSWTISKLNDITRITGGTSSAAVAYGCETAWIGRHEAGRGPPYQRTVYEQTTGAEARVRVRGVDSRFVTVKSPDNLHLAMGLLSLEEDFEGVKGDE